MNSEEFPEINSLLAPINDQTPVGEDLREDSSPESPYYHLKDLRNTARRKERDFSEDISDEVSSKGSDWSEILRNIPELLTSKTKDLELTAWYIEALLRFQGFKGLAHGFSLATALLREYQIDLYPKDEDGLETTLSPLIGLNGIDSDGALITPIGSVPLFVGTSDDFAAWQYEQAVELEKVTDEAKKNQRIQNGAVTLDDISSVVKECNPAQIRAVYFDLRCAIEAYEALVNQIDQLANNNYVPTSNIKNKLLSCETAILAMAGDLVAPEEADIEGDASDFSEESGGTESSQNLNAKGLNREKALKLLIEIAKFFRESEPHSPISYSLEQAVRWSDMALPELLNELIPDTNAKQQFYKFTGMTEAN